MAWNPPARSSKSQPFTWHHGRICLASTRDRDNQVHRADECGSLVRRQPLHDGWRRSCCIRRGHGQTRGFMEGLHRLSPVRSLLRAAILVRGGGHCARFCRMGVSGQAALSFVAGTGVRGVLPRAHGWACGPAAAEAIACCKIFQQRDGSAENSRRPFVEYLAPGVRNGRSARGWRPRVVSVAYGQST